MSAHAITRRGLLATGTAAVAAGALARPGRAAATARAAEAVYFVPGYRTDAASFRGQPAASAAELRRGFPAGYKGGVTLLTRLDERDAAPRRALLPIVGHHVAIAPDRRTGFFSSMNGPGFLAFDPGTLATGAMPPCHDPAFVAGGHAAFTADGVALLTVERRRFDLPATRPEDRHGRLVLRDPRSFAVLESHSTHGIAPHDVCLTQDGRHAVIANYGSTNLPKSGEAPVIVDPCVTVLELDSGRLVYRRSVANDAELRHLAGNRLDRVLALCVLQAVGVEAATLAGQDDRIDEPDPSFDQGVVFRPGPVARFDATRPETPARIVMPDAPDLARYGQSIVYDPAQDEFLVTFASSHTVIAFAGADAAVKRIVRTDRLGLRFPRGIALHPDGAHYAVTGGWQGLYLFRRGSHEVAWERCLHPVFFEHSHLAAMEA